MKAIMNNSLMSHMFTEIFAGEHVDVSRTGKRRFPYRVTTADGRSICVRRKCFDYIKDSEDLTNAATEIVGNMIFDS